MSEKFCPWRYQKRGKWLYGIVFTDVDGRIRMPRSGLVNKTLARSEVERMRKLVQEAKQKGLASVDELLNPRPAISVRKFLDEYVESIQVQSTRHRYTIAKPHIVRHLDR